MRLVLGIGNPGARYSGTRHNIGFDVLDRLAAGQGVSFRKASPLYLEARLADGGCLVKPLTYVNRSGAALSRWCEDEALERDELLVVVDDTNLPLGRMRMRAKGSPGGHNGLRDVERAWGSVDYPRVRLGVGAAESGGLVEHVLTPFETGERDDVDALIARAAEVVARFASGEPLLRVMEWCNRSSAAEPSGGGQKESES